MMSSAVPAPSVDVECFAVVAGVPSARSIFSLADVAVVTAALNRPTSTLTGVAVLDVPSKVTHHSLIMIRTEDEVPSSSTDFAVAADNESASTDRKYCEALNRTSLGKRGRQASRGDGEGVAGVGRLVGAQRTPPLPCR